MCAIQSPTPWEQICRQLGSCWSGVFHVRSRRYCADKPFLSPNLSMEKFKSIFCPAIQCHSPWISDIRKFQSSWMASFSRTSFKVFGQYSVRMSTYGRGRSMQAPTKRTVFSWLTSRHLFISHSSVEFISTWEYMWGRDGKAEMEADTLTFFFEIFFIATRSPLNIPIVAVCEVGTLPQLIMLPRPEWTPNWVNEKFWMESSQVNN